MITGSIHVLPFDRLSPNDFERLALWLVDKEGYKDPKHLGAAGNEQGRDIEAQRDGKTWAFQCKRVKEFGPKAAVNEINKVLDLAENQKPAGLVFITTCNVSDETRRQAADTCSGQIECGFWPLTELDLKVWRHPEIVAEFFGLASAIERPFGADMPVDDLYRIVRRLVREMVEQYEQLRELKEVHNTLQRFCMSIPLFRLEIERAELCRKLDKWRALGQWYLCKMGIGEIKHLAGNLKSIQRIPFEEKQGGLCGDPWIVEIVAAAERVEKALDDGMIEPLLGCAMELDHVSNLHLSNVDYDLRHAADSMAKSLYGALGEGGGH